jgi:hypothetical protein
MKLLTFVLALVSVTCFGAMPPVVRNPYSTNETLTDPLNFNAERFPYTLPFVSTNLWQFTTSTSNAPLALVLVGDSLINNKAAALADVMSQIGYPATTAFGHAVSFAGGAAALASAYTNWMNGVVYVVPNAGAITFGVGGLLCDTVDVYYFTTNGASTFVVATNINGGSFATVHTQNANTGASGLAKARIVLNRADGMTIRITATAGIVYTPGIATQDRATGHNVQIVNLQLSGLQWDSFNQMLPQFATNLGVLLPPGPIIIEETSTAALWLQASNAIEKLTRHKKREVIVITPNPFVNTTQEADNLAQITVIRGVAQTNGWILFDQHAMWGTAAVMTNAGLLDPTGADIHPTSGACYQSVRTMLDLTGLGACLQGTRNAKYGPIITSSASTLDPPPGVINLNPSKSTEFHMRGYPAQGMTMFVQTPDGTIMGGLYNDATLQILVGIGGGHLFHMNKVTGVMKTLGELNINVGARASFVAVTNGLAFVGTNYVAANFVPVAGQVTLVPSNNWLFSVTAMRTNPVVQIAP